MSKALTEKLPTLLMAAVLVVSVAAAGAVVGAQTDGTDAATETDDPATQATSYLRVVHASPDAGPVNVSLDNETVLENVSVTEVSDYLTIEGGERNVTITAAGDESEVYFSENVTFAPRTVTTLAASGEVGAEASDALDVTVENETNVSGVNETDANATGTNETDAGQPFQPVLLDDNAYEPADGESALSLVHLSPDAGAVDVVVDVSEVNTTEDVALSVADDGTELVVNESGETNATDADVSADETELVLADNLSYQNATDYATLPAGDYPIEIRNATAANDGEVLTTVDVTLEEGTAHSAMAVGYENATDAAGDTPFQVVLTEDATTDVQLPGEESPEDVPRVENATDNGTDAVDGLFGDENVTDAPAADGGAAVTFEPQTSNGSTVTVDSVTVPDGGYVAIHNDSLQDGEVVGSVIGVSEYLEAGTHEDVNVTLYDVPGVDFENESLSGDETLTAMPHRETNDNETYDFVATNGSADGAYTVDGEAVTDEGYVNIELGEAPAEEAPPENETLDEEPADDETTNDTLDEQPPDGEAPTDNATNDTLDEQPPDGEVPTDNDTTTQTLDEEPADNETADNDTGNGLFG